MLGLQVMHHLSLEDRHTYKEVVISKVVLRGPVRVPPAPLSLSSICYVLNKFNIPSMHNAIQESPIHVSKYSI